MDRVVIVQIDEPYTITVSDAAARSGLTERRIRELAVDGGPLERVKPPSYKGDRNYLILWPQLKAHLDAGRTS